MTGFDAITALLFTSAFLSILGAFIGWKHRSKPSATPMAALSLCAGLWSLFYLLEYLSPDLQTKLFWALVKTPVVAFLPLAEAAFVLRFAGWLEWPGKRWLLSLSAIPTITTVIAYTNSYHHLFWESYELIQSQGSSWLHTTNGVWFWIHAIYSYGLIIVSATVAFTNLGRTWHIYRRQALLLTTGLLIPLLGNLISVFQLHPWQGIDLSPITFGISAIFLLLTTRLVSILNVVPLAQTVILEQFRDGLMVLNNQDTIMEINKAATKMIGIQRQTVIGRNLKEFHHPALELVSLANKGETVHKEIRLGGTDEPHWYEIRISTIYTKSSVVAGRMVI
jgi:PAS domain S-box-containing protein